MKARGQLKHHFWGTYAASVWLTFENATDAEIARSKVFTDWKANPAHPDTIGFHGTDPALREQLNLLAAHGADLSLVESCATSIDYGEPFTVDVLGCELAVLEAHGQARLFEEVA